MLAVAGIVNLNRSLIIIIEPLSDPSSNSPSSPTPAFPLIVAGRLTLCAVLTVLFGSVSFIVPVPPVLEEDEELLETNVVDAIMFWLVRFCPALTVTTALRFSSVVIVISGPVKNPSGTGSWNDSSVLLVVRSEERR